MLTAVTWCRDDSAKKHRNKNLDPMLFGTAAYAGKGRGMAGP